MLKESPDYICYTSFPYFKQHVNSSRVAYPYGAFILQEVHERSKEETLFHISYKYVATE